MKNKEGRRTSHSYCSWTHGSRWTTHGSSGKHPWWWRSSRRWFLPPAGCREEVSWCSRSWKRGSGGIEERSQKRVLSLGVSRHGEYMGEGGQPWGPPGVQAAPWRGPTLGRGGRAPGALVGPLWPLLGNSRSFRSADFLLYFPGIFGALLVWGK